MSNFPLTPPDKVDKQVITVKVNKALIERLKACIPEGITMSDIVVVGIADACAFYENQAKKED